MDIKISIIVPVYNVEKYLERCLDSILNQTFREFELILVNDGSTDNSYKICNKYLALDDRIKVIHKENGGLSDARNVGINVAKGNYIGFIDSDDYINHNMFQILYSNAIKYNSDIVICDFEKVNEDDIVNYKHQEAIKETKVFNFNNIEALEQIYINPNATFVVAWNKLYKKDLFSDLRFKTNVIHEDEFIAHEIIYKSNKITYIPIKLYYYVQRNNSIMSSTFSIKKLDLLDALKNRVDFLYSINEYKLQHIAERYYIEAFLNYYGKAKRDICKPNEKIDKYKKDFNSIINLNFLFKNQYFSLKEKISLLLLKLKSA